MSLEATIEANTAALRDLIAAIKAGVPTTAAQVSAVAQQAAEARAQDGAAEKPTETKATAKKPAAATAPAPQPSIATAADAAPTYQDAARAVTELANAKGTDTARAVLKQFGADKLPAVDPEQFAAVVAACEAAAQG